MPLLEHVALLLCPRNFFAITQTGSVHSWQRASARVSTLMLSQKSPLSIAISCLDPCRCVTRHASQVLGAVGFDVPVIGTFTLAASADDDRVISAARPYDRIRSAPGLGRSLLHGRGLKALTSEWYVTGRSEEL